MVLQKVASEQAAKQAPEETSKATTGLMDHNIAEVVVGVTDALNKFQAYVLQAFVLATRGQA